MTNHLDPNQEFLKALAELTQIDVVESYRAYYDDTGKVVFLAANQFPDSGNWVEITRELYVKQDYQWLWVISGQIVERKFDGKHYFQLTKSTKGVKVVKYHAGIVVEPNEEYVDIEYYDKRTY